MSARAPIYDLINAKCAPKVTVTIQQSIVPDVSRSYSLLPRTNIFYTDALNLGVDTNGFLTNGALTSTSEVTHTASAIANDVGLAGAPSVGVPGGLPAAAAPLGEVGYFIQGAKPAPKPVGPTCNAVASVGYAVQIASLAVCDPVKTKSDAAGAGALARQLLADFAPGGSMPEPAQLPNLQSSLLPMTFYTTLDNWGGDGKLKAGSLATFASRLKLDLNLICAPRKEDAGWTPGAGVPENPPRAGADGKPPPIGVYNGIVVSASRQCRFEARQERQLLAGAAEGVVGTTEVLIADSYFLAEDSRYLTILPTERGFLVARSVSYTFSGGQPTGVTDSRPSEALALVSFPGQVVGSFFSGLTSAFTNSQAYLNGKTADLTAQYNYLAAKVNVLEESQKAATAVAPP